VNRKALDELKQQIPLLDYLHAHDWQAARSIRDGRLMGLCPLHTDHKPSFLVDPGRNLFYCYGCARGGDVIRFAELYHQVKFPQAVVLLREWCAGRRQRKRPVGGATDIAASLVSRSIRATHPSSGRVGSKQLLRPGRQCATVSAFTGGRSPMTFRVAHKPAPSPARSPYRVIEQTTGREIDWINRYLDYESLRRVSGNTLRSYAHELLHFLRWWESVHHTDAVVEGVLTESTLLDYVRFQSGQEPPLCGATINQRVAIADRALRTAFPGAPGQIAPGFQTTYWQRAPMGIGKPRLATSRLRVRTPKRTIVPLSVDEVARFWASFRNSRDLAIVGLNAFAGTPIPGSPRPESRRSAVAGSADPRARQG